MEYIDCSQVGSERDDRIFATSSTCGSSSVHGPHNPKHNTRAKSLKNFKSINSIRRRAKSRTIHHSPVATSDEDYLLNSFESSSLYMEPTSCPPGKKTVSLGRNNKPSRTLSRTPSFRNSRILIKKGSFVPKRGSTSYSKATEDVAVVITRAKCSPTLKISIKFPEHAQCCGAHDTVARRKRFVYDRRRLLRLKRSSVPQTELEKVDRNENGVGEKGLFGLDGRHCPSCSCNNNDNQIPQFVVKRPREQVVDYIEDVRTSSCADEKPNHKDCQEEDAVRYIETTKTNIRAPIDFNPEGEVDCTTESAPAGSLRVNKVVQRNAPTEEVGQLHFSKPDHISTWNLMHQSMTSNSGALEGECPVEGEKCSLAIESRNSDSENQESELHKTLATKLVREAIEKILLPEVQDQTSDDHSSVSSASTPRVEIFERNRAEAFAAENCPESNGGDKDEGNTSAQPKQETRKSGSKAPKHWSNLKKWILLQRFIRELEKVKKLKPKNAQFIPLNPDSPEKVNLRPLTAEGRKNSEEWMLDYALRQAVGQLAPTQKKKVALLVRAFEAVAPTEVDEHEPALDQCRGPDKSVVFVENQESGLKVEGKTEECGQGNENIQMWHMIYQHVVSGIAGKVGNQLLDEEKEVEDSVFAKPDALKLVKEAVHEILLPETQDESVEKLKNLTLLKRSIIALEKARQVEPREYEPVKIELRCRQMLDEKIKAEQWMLDYAVRHIVTKLTPSRKRRVCMLVEAFEAVVPFPDM